MTNLFEIFLQKNIPQNNWNKLILYTRYNDKIVYKNTKISENNGYFINGITISKKDKYILTIRTVENNEEKISCRLTFNLNYNYINGIVNCFGLGFIKCDKHYLKDLLKELNRKDKIIWDIIK